MKHIRPATKEARLMLAQNEILCRSLLIRSTPKCVDGSMPLVLLVKRNLIV